MVHVCVQPSKTPILKEVQRDPGHRHYHSQHKVLALHIQAGPKIYNGKDKYIRGKYTKGINKKFHKQK